VTSGIAGTLTIDAAGGADNQLSVDNSGSTTAGTSITLGFNTTTGLYSIAGTGLATTTEIDYTASGGGAFADPTANADDGVLVKGEQPTSGAGDTFNIQNTYGNNSTTKVIGSALNDTFNVFDNTSGSNKTNNIAGMLTIDALAGADNRLIVDNSGASAGQIVTLSDAAAPGYKAITGLAPGEIDYAATGGNFLDPATPTVNDGILLRGSNSGGNTFNVQSTLGGSTTEIDGDGTSDIFNVSSDAPTNGGKLAGIQGILTVKGGSGTNNRLIVSDYGDSSSDTAVFVTNYSITGFAPAAIYYSAAGTFNNPATPTVNNGILLRGSNQGGNTFNVQSTLTGSTTEIDGDGPPTGNPNTFNIGSLAPASGGIVDNIQGALTVVGNGADTMNVDDTGSTAAKTGTLTATTLTGLNMGPSGITYSGLAKLNINLGSGGSTGNSFFINVADGTNLPALTNITAAQGGKDSLVGKWVTDFNGTLNLLNFVTSTITVGNNFNGTMTDKNPGYIQSITIGGSLTASGVLLVSSSSDPVNPTTPVGLLGDIGTMTVGGSIAGLVQTTGNITTLNVGPANTPTTGDVNDVSGQVLVAGQLTTASVSGNVSGLISETLTINSLYIGGSLSRSGIVSAVNAADPAKPTTLTGLLGNINSMNIGIDLAGQLIVSGALKTLTVHGGTPGTVTAGLIGTMSVNAGYGPLVGQIKENGIQRRIEADVPGAFPTPPPPPAPILPVAPAGITFQYFYEGLVSPSVEGISSTKLANPQLTARVSNATVNTGPDQFDLNLVTYSDTAKFNLARLDATGNSGVSGIRNVAVEGDILTSITAAASSFFAPDTSPAGVYLPQDTLAGVEVRDFFPLASVNAKTIQAVAFGSSVGTNGVTVTGQNDTGPAARNVLTTSTLIIKAGSLNVNAGETFRVPFADLSTQQVRFFIDTSTTNGSFDNKDIDFTLQGVSTANSAGTGNNTQPSNVARGAVVALITAVETFNPNTPGLVKSEVMENISLQGDGGSLTTFQPVGNTPTLPVQSFTPSITSTGPLGDVSVLGAMPSITAPSIFGSLTSTGAIPATSIIQTTGVRIDPITGASSAVSADFGRVYVTSSNKVSVVTTSIVQPSGTLDGKIISRGNLISLVEPSGNLTGLVAAQGNIGTFFTPSGGKLTRLGGITVGNPNSGRTLNGQVLTLGSIIGDVTINGGTVGGRIAARNSIVGNVTIVGTIDSNSALVSGGSIGSGTYGTKLNSGNILGIVAAVGPINAGTIGTTNTAQLYVQNDTADAAVIDSIFTQGVTPLSAADVFDQATLGDLLNLNQMTLNLSNLKVKSGKLSLS
jgi:acrosin